MKIEVVQIKADPEQKLWRMKVDLKEAPSCLKFPSIDWWDNFDKAMDAAFIYPFELRRYGGWRRVSEHPRKRVYWCYVIFSKC